MNPSEIDEHPAPSQEALILKTLEIFNKHLKEVCVRLERLEKQAEPLDRFYTPMFVTPKKNDVILFQQHKDTEPLIVIADGKLAYDTAKILQCWRLCEGEMRDMARRHDK